VVGLGRLWEGSLSYSVVKQGF